MMLYLFTGDMSLASEIFNPFALFKFSRMSLDSMEFQVTLVLLK